ncbi:MAG: PD-(D/E)XK nuclease family protein [Sulfurihydrogenibium sp.]|nr:PD-(D/E)XK nuclease family protein [Sulfurihydrogenibium sp.]
MLEISASGINLYLQCPYSFKLKYIDKIEISQQESISLITGRLVHRCLELFFKDRMNIGDVYLKPSDYMKVAIEDFNHINPLLLDEAVEEADHYLTIYNRVAQTITPESSEEYFEMELNNNLKLRGYIDLIAREGKKRVLIDFKTTRSNIKDNPKYTLQLSLYSLTHKADSYFLHYITPTSVQVKEIKPIDKIILHSIINSVENSVIHNNFPPTGMINEACNSCLYRKICKFATIK